MSGPAEALIGHTGFVGSNLFQQHSFAHYYNSTNIESIAGRQFDLLVCAGVRAEKWIANANPVADRLQIDRLLSALSTVSASRVVLISTVDVFAVPSGADESSPVEPGSTQPYGINRRYLEREVASRFDACIVRLPALYGRGLKKNVIYDLLNDHETGKIDSRGVFQFYGVDRLWSDIGIALDARLEVVHLVTEPASVAEIAARAFNLAFTKQTAASPVHYDLHTRHSGLFGGHGHYIESRDRVLDGLARFVARERAT